MSIVDPVSDMLTRIRNAYGIGAETASFESSKLKLSVLEVIKKAGYVADYKKEENKLTVTLKYEDGKPVVTKLERVSKPGRRVYVGKEDIPQVLSGHGLAVISTSKGVMSGKDAKRENLGGELICKVF